MAATDYIIFGAVLGVFFLLVLCVLSVVFWQDKGQAGENQIHQSLNRLEGQSAILQNCYLPLKNSGTTEVDLILIHESGIYVIESKNYSGWIFGSESQRYWTQSLPGHNGTAEKHRFYNPIWQNKTHIQCLKNLLNDNTIPVYSYIVFGNGCELKNITLTRNSCHVIYERYLVQDISENAKLCGKCLSDEKIATLYAFLSNFTGASDEQKERHIKEIHEKTISGDSTGWNMDMSTMRRKACSACGKAGRKGRTAFLGLLQLSKVSFYLSAITNPTHRFCGAPFFAQFWEKCAIFLIQNHG